MKKKYSEEEHDFCVGMQVRFQHYTDNKLKTPGKLQQLLPRASCVFLNYENNGYRIYDIPEYEAVRQKKLTKLIMGTRE